MPIRAIASGRECMESLTLRRNALCALRKGGPKSPLDALRDLSYHFPGWPPEPFPSPWGLCRKGDFGWLISGQYRGR